MVASSYFQEIQINHYWMSCMEIKLVVQDGSGRVGSGWVGVGWDEMR